MSEVISYPTSTSITEVTITKFKATSKVGVSLKKVARESGISISGLTEDSPLQGTAIRSKGGQVLLAVNGDPNLPDVSTAASILQSRQRLSFLVCDQPNTACSCLQIVAAPFFQHNPGLNFTTTRGRTLVSISKIFKTGGFAGSKYVHKGDIVLAVNGIPVSKPEEADRALRFPKGDVTVLHLVDLQFFRALLIGSVDRNLQLKQDKGQPILMAPRNGSSTTPLPIHYDPETQHMYDPTPWLKMDDKADKRSEFLQGSKSPYKSWYQRVRNFMDKFNEKVDAALDPLEDLACEYAWRANTSTILSQRSSLQYPVSPSSTTSPRASTVTPGSLRPTVLVEDSNVFIPLPPARSNSETDPLSPKSPKEKKNLDYIAC